MQVHATDPHSDREQALLWLWERVIACASAMTVGRTGRPFSVGADDANLRTGTAAEIFDWLADCDTRLGCEVGQSQAAALAFLMAREGVPATAASREALTAALQDAVHAFHMNHPIVRGLLAVLDHLALLPAGSEAPAGQA